MSNRNGPVLPHDWDLETAVLGGIFVNDENLAEVRGVVDAAVFHKPAHRVLFKAMCELGDRGSRVTEAAVLHRLRETGAIEMAGGMMTVLGMRQFCAVEWATPSHAKQLRQVYLRRNAIETLEDALTRLRESPDADPSEVLASAQNRVDEKATRDDEVWTTIGEATYAALGEVKQRAEQPDHLPGIPTGWRDLDHRIAGWRPSRVYVIAARPKMGKSAFVQQTALHAASLGYGVGFVSLEMDRLEIGERALAMTGRVDAGRMVRGEISPDEDWARLVEAAERLSALPLFIADRPAQTLAQLRGQTKQLRKRCEVAGTKLGMLVVDYLQLMNGSAERGSTRQEVVAALSRGIKLLAKELEIPILLLSQLSRKVEERAVKHPELSDLRESGSIEQDADAVMFLYRDDVYDPQSPKPGVCTVMVKALRGGQAGDVDLAYIGKEYRFADLADREPEPYRRPASGYARSSQGRDGGGQ